MTLEKNNLLGLSLTSASVVSSENASPPIHRSSPSLTIRVQQIDCMLADIQAHIQILRRERTHLGLVRAELAGVEPKLRRT